MASINALAGQAPIEGPSGDTIAGTGGAMDPSKRPRNLPEAAQQFESLLIAELLRMSHSEEVGWLGSGEDSTASPAMGMAEESLAQAISSHGGLGLSKYVVQSLSK